MDEKEDRLKEVVEKYGIDLEKLKREQLKLSKNLEFKNKINFDLIDRVAGIDNVFFKNKIISAVVVVDNDFEILEQEYFSAKLKFPYLPGFRAYRELPSMVSCFSKIDEKPDVVFVRGHGILHPRNLGLASHFSLSVDAPTIGVADSLLVGEVKDSDILLNGKIMGKIVRTKEGAKPLYVSIGNKISLNSAIKLVKKFTVEPHKFPEPLRLAKKYAKEIRKELFKV